MEWNTIQTWLVWVHNRRKSAAVTVLALDMQTTTGVGLSSGKVQPTPPPMRMQSLVVLVAASTMTTGSILGALLVVLLLQIQKVAV